MGDTFDQFVKINAQKAYRLASRLLWDTTQAEEVTQEATLKLWHEFERLEATHRLPWLLQVTRNACLDILRRRRVIHAETAGSHTEAQCHWTPEHRQQADELGEHLDRAIGKLAEPYRSLVVLCDLEGFNHSEAASALSLSREQVKVYLYRARRQLRRSLWRWYDDE